MLALIFAILTATCSAIDIEQLCYCQSRQSPHFKENKDKSNPCNVVELHLNGTLIKEFNVEISQQLLENVPIIKFPGRKLVKHNMMTLVLFKPITISSLKPDLRQNIFIHWLISQVPSSTSRMNLNHTYNLSPGYQYIEYLPPQYNNNNDNKDKNSNKYILAFYHQHQTKDYFSAHRYRKFNHFFNSIGKMIICNIIDVTP